MGTHFEELFASWDGESVHVAIEPELRAWFFICVHSTERGPSTGGIRMKHYPDPGEALRDGLRLSGAMTLKMAVCDAPLGGGKSIIATPPEMDASVRREVLERYARHLGALKGTYYGAPDMNTSPDDMDFIYARAPYVFCRTVEAGGSGSTSPGTALGVFQGILATVHDVFGSDDIGGRRVVVQGIGGVGGHLLRMLCDRGAEVVVSDVAANRVDAAIVEFAVEAVSVEAAATTECDVFSPCAVGGVLDEESIPRLRCRIVAGAANNQLATIEDDQRLRAAGIRYAPDFVINAGGVLHGVGLEIWGWSETEFEKAARGIGDTLITVYRMAEREGIGTHVAAEQLARTRLARGREGSHAGF